MPRIARRVGEELLGRIVLIEGCNLVRGEIRGRITRPEPGSKKMGSAKVTTELKTVLPDPVTVRNGVGKVPPPGRDWPL